MKLQHEIGSLIVMMAIAGLAVVGCREELSPQTQTAPAASSTSSNEAPLSGQVGQGGGSALGGAKRAATNVVDQAEKKSQETAEQADDFFNDD